MNETSENRGRRAAHAGGGACTALALASLLVVGCGASSAPVDAASLDAGSEDAGGADAGSDAARPGDSGISFTSMTLVTTLTEDCMPVVAPDPLPIDGMLRVTNTGSAPIGPLHVEAGLVVQLLGGETLATFAIAPIDLPAIAPGATGSAAFTKTAGSLAGGAGLSGCDVVACGAAVRIALLLTGPGIPDGARASSEPLTVGCAF